MVGFLKTLYNKPINFMQVVATLLLAIGFLSTLVGWIATDGEASEAPLVLTGIMAILLIMSRVESSFTVGISILIIGTVVASDRFMLAATALIGGESAKDVTLLLRAYKSNERLTNLIQSNEITIETLAQHITDKISASPSMTDASPPAAIELVLQQASIREVADQVRVLDVETPLDDLVAGGAQWRNFVDRYRDITPFQEDMFTLKRLGLADFPESQFARAAPTDIGKAVNEFLESREELGKPSDELRDRELQDENDPAITLIDVGTQTEIRFADYWNQWFKFELSRQSTLEIRTKNSSIGTDPLLRIYRASNLKEPLDQNDDLSSDNLESRINRPLSAGLYLVEVINLDRQAGYTTISIEEPTTGR